MLVEGDRRLIDAAVGFSLVLCGLVTSAFDFDA
jgi:hypothetical protein